MVSSTSDRPSNVRLLTDLKVVWTEEREDVCTSCLFSVDSVFCFFNNVWRETILQLLLDSMTSPDQVVKGCLNRAGHRAILNINTMEKTWFFFLLWMMQYCLISCGKKYNKSVTFFVNTNVSIVGCCVVDPVYLLLLNWFFWWGPFKPMGKRRWTSLGFNAAGHACPWHTLTALLGWSVLNQTHHFTNDTSRGSRSAFARGHLKPPALCTWMAYGYNTRVLWRTLLILGRYSGCVRFWLTCSLIPYIVSTI